MTAPRAVYCYDLDMCFRSAQEAQQRAGNHKKGTFIATACRATAVGRYLTAYGRQWCWADSIPEVWPQKPKVSRVNIGSRVPVISQFIYDGSTRRWASVSEAAKGLERPRTIISHGIKATSLGIFFQARGYRFARADEFDRPDFRWPRRGPGSNPLSEGEKTT